MALSKLSRKRRWLIKYLLAEEIEDEEVILQMYGGKRAKIHLMFELRNEEGIFQKLITNHLREHHNKFAEFSSSENLGAMMIQTLTPSKSTDRMRLRLYSPPSQR